MTISACPRCGSRNIRQGTMGDGVLTGYTTRDVCRNCGFQGTPLLFDSEQQYKNFLKGLSKEIVQEDTQGSDTDEELSDKEKEVISFLHELEDEPRSKESASTWTKHKRWWPEIFFALIISSFITFTGFVDWTVIIGVGGALFYSALGFIASFVIILFGIVFIEYSIRCLFTER